MKKVHRVIKFNQKVWLKSYIDTNTKLRQKAKNNFEKDFSKLMNNAAFEKTMENVRKHRYTELVATERRGNYLLSEPNYHITRFFTKHLLAIEMKKTHILVNQPVYIGLSILDLSKTVMCEFWYDYVKPKFSENGNICYLDTDTFIVYIKAGDIYKDIVEDVKKKI